MILREHGRGKPRPRSVAPSGRRVFCLLEYVVSTGTPEGASAMQAAEKQTLFIETYIPTVNHVFNNLGILKIRYF